jgi:large subunit ribosomal protein L37Ae
LVSRRKHRSSSLKGLGIKFGATVRKRYGMAYKTLKEKRRCPSCGSLQLHRIALGIWHCPKCNYKIASGAYEVNL